MRLRRRGDFRWLTARPIAHRGLHDLARSRPENTLSAFHAAVTARYAIECDLHPAADGDPVVFHDDDLQRLTGETGCVRDRTAAELGDLRVGNSREWIPTLQELLELVDGRVPLVIELKSLRGRDSGFARAVVDVLRRYDGPAALMSFHPTLLADVKAMAPHLPRGFIAEGDWRRGADYARAALGLGVDFLSYRIDDLPTPMPVIANRVFGLPLICWTVRTSAQRQRAAVWCDQITFEGFLP